jgi:hypothetical protein
VVTLNDRINDMLSRLEAAATAANEPNRSASQPNRMPKTQKESKPMKSFSAPEDEWEMVSSRIKTLEKKKSQPKSRPVSVRPDMNAPSLIQGIIWAEILGKPVSKRQGRGRFGF